MVECSAKRLTPVTVFRTDGGRDRIRLGFADEACSVVIHNILKDTGTGIVAGNEEHSV